MTWRDRSAVSPSFAGLRLVEPSFPQPERMRLVDEYLVLALPSLPSLIAIRSLSISSSQLLLPTLPSSRPPLPHPLLLYQLTSLPTPTPILSFFHRPTSSTSSLPLPALIFDNILLDSLFDRIRLHPEPPYLSCLYLTPYRQTLLPNPRSYSSLVISSQKPPSSTS